MMLMLMLILICLSTIEEKKKCGGQFHRSRCDIVVYRCSAQCNILVIITCPLRPLHIPHIHTTAVLGLLDYCWSPGLNQNPAFQQMEI
ncbi:hypothetical protein F5B19DRAFT_9553 [Rostrohypoxylon terebratum]|nr:hypothetical protein F5B19DRAFT_9553 [Rostrohypoxylon terebratum]